MERTAYDYELCEVFFKELGLPEPDVNLNVKSGSHSLQTAKLMIGFERAIDQFGPSIAIAEGDTNTVMTTDLASIKSNVPFAHVEAGLRSYDNRMPDEVSFVVADSCSEGGRQ